MLLNPNTETFAHLDAPSGEIMRQTVAFFENKGKAKLIEAYHERIWYTDFLDFIKDNLVFANLLTPSAYGDGDPAVRWDTYRNCDFNEILGFYSLPHWYAWQVSMLGLGPVWMSGNRKIEERTARLLRQGGIFAFGLSEKAHGADLYASEMALTPLGNGRYVADGGKYYIGNGNAAALVSVFGKNSETDDYVFFAVDPSRDGYTCVQNVVSWQGYVAELALTGYSVDESEILSTGSTAWDAALNTINICKFNLGWAAIGICTHAMYEAVAHAADRQLYGKHVTDFPHVQQLLADAWLRLVAMRLFASRAADYMRAASADDRRYLLYNPMVKMKVTTQGETVMNLLWDVIAAKGFEKDVYFYAAAHEIRSLPKLEGTVHVNMALIVKFMANYFFNPADFPQIPKMDAPGNDDFLFAQGPTKGLGKIRFHDYRLAYDTVDLPNVAVFKEQIAALRQFLLQTPPGETQIRDIDFLLSLGELFTLVAYGQLIVEKARMERLPDDVLDLMFNVMVRDFSANALQLYHKPSSTQDQMHGCLGMIRKPVVDPARFQRIWQTCVDPLKDAYAMRP